MSRLALAATAAALAGAGVAASQDPPPDPPVLALSVSGPARALGGTEKSYRVQVRNRGAVTAARDVQVSVPVPPEAFLAERPRSARVSARTVLVRFGSIAPGTSEFVVIGIRWERNAAGRKCLTASARADNAARVANGEACTRLVPQSAVEPRSVPRARVSGPERLVAGRTGQFAVTVVNTSNAATKNASAALVLAPGVFVARRSPGMILTGDSVVWSLGVIRPGASRRLPVALRAAVTTRGLRCNVAYVTAQNAARIRRSGLCTRVAAPG